jgi:transcription antitermination factor NusG
METAPAAVAANSLLMRPPDETHWYVAQTCSRHEKKVNEQLLHRHVETFLPLYTAIHNWKDRRKKVDLPIFPGYLFVRIPLEERLRILELPGVVRFICSKGRPIPLSDDDIGALRNGLAKKVKAEPYPFLTVGQRVRVKSGPLEGMSGILIRKKQQYRVVLSLDPIGRSVAVEVDISDIESAKSS